MRIVLLHCRRGSLLKRAFETAFPSLVYSIHVPSLEMSGEGGIATVELLDYFRRWVYDPEIWSDRVLTVYGSGTFHHWTYALTRLAVERKRLQHSTRRRHLHQCDKQLQLDNRRNGLGCIRGPSVQSRTVEEEPALDLGAQHGRLHTRERHRLGHRGRAGPRLQREHN